MEIIYHPDSLRYAIYTRDVYQHGSKMILYLLDQGNGYGALFRNNKWRWINVKDWIYNTLENNPVLDGKPGSRPAGKYYGLIWDMLMDMQQPSFDFYGTLPHA